MISAEVQLIDNKDEILSQFKASVEKALEEIGLQAESNAKMYCPVDTGRLRNSISHSADDSSAAIGTNVEYAPYQELGTSKMQAANGGRGFLRPSVEDNIDQYRTILMANLGSSQ